jgi:predicted MFS family arabinose efflux permease
MALAGFGASSLILLALAGVLLDFAVQSHHVLSLRDIYALRGDARARINSVYMTSIFVGGAITSAVTGALFDAWGWTGVTIFAAILPAVGALIWLEGRAHEH